MWELYKWSPSFVLGFHGCDEQVGEEVLAGKGHLRRSTNDHDWLGEGIYFWEGSPQRAQEWAEDAKANPKATRGKITTPFVVGAIIDLGICCSLFDTATLQEIRAAFDAMKVAYASAGTPMPENKGPSPDKVMRYRDRAVIELMHSIRETGGEPRYQTVRAAFGEGGALYDGALLTRRHHIQIAVRDESCIKGYFRPIRKA